MYHQNCTNNDDLSNTQNPRPEIRLTALDLSELGKIRQAPMAECNRCTTLPQAITSNPDTMILSTFGKTCLLQAAKQTNMSQFVALRRESAFCFNPALQRHFVTLLGNDLQSVGDHCLLLADGLGILFGTKSRTCSLGVAAQVCATSASAVATAIGTHGLAVPQIIRDVQTWLRMWAKANRHRIIRHLRIDDAADLRGIAELRGRLCGGESFAQRQSQTGMRMHGRVSGSLVNQGVNRLQLDRVASKLGVAVRSVSGTGEAIYSHPLLGRSVRVNLRRKDASRALVVLFRRAKKRSDLTRQIDLSAVVAQV